MMKEQIEQYELSLFLQKNNLERMSILDQKSDTNLKYVRHAKHIFLQSSQTCNGFLRIFFVSLFQFLQRTHDKSTIFTLKNLVYSSHLFSLCRCNGIQEKELHTIFAEQMKKITQKEVKTEEQLIGIFNTIPFFENILFSSFQEQSLLQNFNDNSTLCKQIEELFDIKIKIVEQFDINEHCQQQQDFKFFISKDNRISRISKLFLNDSPLFDYCDSPKYQCLKTVSNDKFSEQICQKENLNSNHQISLFNKDRNSHCQFKCKPPKKTKGFLRFWCCSD